MSLRAQAEADLAATLEAPGDFGDPFTLTSPAGFSSSTQLYGQTGDIGLVLDPSTGLAISGRHATVTVRISTLVAAGYSELPRGVADPTSIPWVVEFGGRTYKVAQTQPDRTLGFVTLILEFYKALP